MCLSLKISILPLLPLLVFVEGQIDFSSFPKCCNHGEILTKNITYTCKRDERKVSYLHLDYVHFPNNCTGEDLCIDFFESGNNYETILLRCPEDDLSKITRVQQSSRKCCPFGKVYDPIEHKCTIFKNASHDDDDAFSVVRKLNFPLGEIKFGLPDCTDVIVDTIIPSNKSVLTNSVGDTKNSCVDLTTDGVLVIRECKRKAVCKFNQNCVKKCCKDGHSFVGGAKCAVTFSHGFNISYPGIKIEGEFAIIQPEPCKKHIVKKNYTYHIDEHGILHRTEKGAVRVYGPLEHTYCMEYVEARGRMEDGYYMFFCLDGPEVTSTEACLIISAVFLLLTIIGYLLLPELRNLCGKTLICYCTSLLIAYICLCVANFNDRRIVGAGCRFLGYMITFTFLAAFGWLNVMCFDIWYTFSGIKSARVQQKRKENRKFIYYNVYAWSIAFIITLIILLMNIYEPFESQYLPTIGLSNCFFERTSKNYGDIIFFRTPVGILIVANLYFFVSTTYYCNKVKNEISRMTDGSGTDRKKKFNADKERLLICLKLFLIMGVFWIMEIITSMYSFRHNNVLSVIEKVFDVLNALQGLFIFLIYMCKKKVYRSIKKKLGFAVKTDSTTESTLTTESSLSNNSKKKNSQGKVSLQMSQR